MEFYPKEENYDKYISESLLIRKAEVNEARSLSNLAIRSKAHWGYSPEFMAACENELVIAKSKLESDRFLYMVAEGNDEELGYYALERISESEFELEALFVEPKHIGSGIGRALLAHAKEAAAKMGGVTLIIQGDPNAEKFYLAAGGVRTGERESESIPGRFLPMFSISLIGNNVA